MGLHVHLSSAETRIKLCFDSVALQEGRSRLNGSVFYPAGYCNLFGIDSIDWILSTI